MINMTISKTNPAEIDELETIYKEAFESNVFPDNMIETEDDDEEEDLSPKVSIKRDDLISLSIYHNPSVKDNYDRIDFERKWDHLRTKLGKMLSFDELDLDDESLACWDDEPIDDEAALIDLTQRFLASLDDETDRNIVLFKLQGKTQSEIAETLGFSQGTIAKRLKKIKAKFYSL